MNALETIAEYPNLERALEPNHLRHIGPHGLMFTDTGRMRLAHVMGWIRGISLTNPERAEYYARELYERLDYLAGYGGDIEDPEPWENGDAFTSTVPRYKVVLGDDGTFNGFTIGWYLVVPDITQLSADTVERWVLRNEHLSGGCCATETRYGPGYESRVYHYQYSMNGGLLYHGETGDAVFAVQTGTHRPWGVHT